MIDTPVEKSYLCKLPASSFSTARRHSGKKGEMPFGNITETLQFPYVFSTLFHLQRFEIAQIFAVGRKHLVDHFTDLGQRKNS